MLVFKAPLKVYAFSGTQGRGQQSVPPGAVFLDLAKAYRPVVQSYGLPGLSGRIQVVTIDWPDMATPALGAEGWRQVAKVLARNRKPVYIACGFGHGRTGTALAILGHFLGAYPRLGDPVAWVRNMYCEEAVESAAQVKYVAAITGREVQATGSQKYTVSRAPEAGRWTPEQGWVPTATRAAPLTRNISECMFALGGHKGCDRSGHYFK